MLPSPLTLVCGGESDDPSFGPPASLSLHLPSSSITPAGSVHKSRGDNVGAVEEMVWVLQRGHSGDGCDLVSTLCNYDLRKGDSFVLSSEFISSELLMCSRGVCSILLLLLVARCLETIDVCTWCMFVFMSVVVTVWGSVGMFGV